MYVTLGQAIFEPEAPARPAAAAPDVLPWDPTGNQNPSAAVALNRGCPVGYFAQLVAPGQTGARPYGNPDAWVRCRLMQTSNQATITRESGNSARETIGIFTSAVRQTLAELPTRLPRLVMWALGGAVGLVGLGAVLAGWRAAR